MKSNWIMKGLIFFLALACQTNTHEESDDTLADKWSVRLADTIMQRHPQLVYYNRKPGKEKLQYDVAMLGMAIDKLGSVDEKYSLYLKNYLDFYVDSLGQIKNYKVEEYNLDRINFARNLITLYKRTGDTKYRIAIESFVKQIEGHPKTKSGGFWHKEIYPSQMWLDGAYMAMPFITQYAKEFNRSEWFDLATYQLTLLYANTVDEESGLMYHAWDESRTQRWCNPLTGQSRQFWGRSMGWYLMAVVDVLDYLPENHSGREDLIHILNKVSAALVKVRDDETGVWYQVLDKAGMAGNYLEASSTAMFAYVLAKGAKNGYLPAEYKEIAQSVFNDMIEEFVANDAQEHLVIRNICGGCGLGGDPYRDGSYEYYITEERVLNDPKGVGAFVLAAIELEN